MRLWTWHRVVHMQVAQAFCDSNYHGPLTSLQVSIPPGGFVGMALTAFLDNGNQAAEQSQYSHVPITWWCSQACFFFMLSTLVIPLCIPAIVISCTSRDHWHTSSKHIIVCAKLYWLIATPCRKSYAYIKIIAQLFQGYQKIWNCAEFCANTP